MTAEHFFEAVKKGDLAEVRSQLNSDPACLSARDLDGSSGVLLAAYYGHTDVLREILARRPELTVFEAAASGQSEAVRDWLMKDASLALAFAPDGYTALGLASFFGHLETVNLLLGRGAEVNVAARNDMAVRPLHSAAAARHLAIAEVLIAHGADVNATSHGGFTALHSAAHNGQIELVRILLQNGARPDAADDQGLTPAQMARQRDHIEVADLLARHSR